MTEMEEDEVVEGGGGGSPPMDMEMDTGTHSTVPHVPHEILTKLRISADDLDWTSPTTRNQTSSRLIQRLTPLLTDLELSALIGSHFRELVHPLLQSYYSQHVSGTSTDLEDKFHGIYNMVLMLCRFLSKNQTAVETFTLNFLKEIDSPFSFIKNHFAPENEKPKAKKLKTTFQPRNWNFERFLQSLLILLKQIQKQQLSVNWDVKEIIELINCTGAGEIKWLSIQILGFLLNLSDTELKRLRQGFREPTVAISRANQPEPFVKFQLEFEKVTGRDYVEENSSGNRLLQLPNNAIVKYSNGLIAIGGTLINTTNGNLKNSITAPNPSSKIQLVELDSTVSLIRQISLSLSSASNLTPICLVGNVGTGKSSILEYTATLFGKADYPQFISVQMSDQIDSRLLLGSYHSTDLPGHFVWKAGCLTKAVLNGGWIVFEDIDSAPSDVMGLLDGLIDTNSLSVPGFGEIEQIHSGFRILATSRVQKGQRPPSLGKQWKTLFVDSATESESKFLISSLFPHLKPLQSRLYEIFEIVHGLHSELRKSNERFVSLRDFLKLCRRIPATIDITETGSSLLIFQEAMDVFVACFDEPGKRIEIAEAIGVQLNLLKAKADFFCTAYKPLVNISSSTNSLTCGRFTLPFYSKGGLSLSSLKLDTVASNAVFSLTKRASLLMEMLGGSIVHHEPALLIGETGVGKTSCVQYLASVLQQKLIVVNLNRQSDSGDLLGGYKPVELKYIFGPVREEFETLFALTFSREQNAKFLTHIMTCFANRRWNDLVKLMIHVQKMAIQRCGKEDQEKLERWTTLGNQLARIETQINSGEGSPFAFSFIEGSLVTAIKNGYWILLDEINLATPEMLQCLSGILEEHAQIHLWEKGDGEPIVRHPNFHLFAAMNPSTDVGKKSLPLGLRNRFTEFYVEELTDPMELQILVSDYLRELSLSNSQIDNIVQFYLAVKTLSQTSLVDGMGRKPHFSLRTLCRALKISSLNLYGSIRRSLYESFCLSFLTQLDYNSHPIVANLVAKYIFGNSEVKGLINHPLPMPPSTSGSFVQVQGYWIPQGEAEPKSPESYILTPSVRRNLKDLARIVSAGKLPVLLQGETSVGKTSLIQFLAQTTGNTCFRINNHQHTDLQEYVGSYQSDPSSSGKLVFTEGVLVQAMRRGHWIILDELNLAPSEVLEALNRLLDDNRQLFIAETGTTITAHPRFLLFATQNPPGLYGGRKLLSRAFRNRFVELHFDEIPSKELEIILHQRCAIPESYCKRIIGVLKELQIRRKSSAALEGKHGFATLRDLFRWAERYRQSGNGAETTKSTFYDWDQHLADEGFLVLAGKVRNPLEAQVIQEVLQKYLKRVVSPDNLFSLHDKTSLVTRPILESVLNTKVPGFEHIVWTFQLRRLAVLIGSSLKFHEPVLLVGETGVGKTSIVQLLTALKGQTLFSVNCHMHSEGSDFLGGLRPVRDHSKHSDDRLFEWVDGPLVQAMGQGGTFLADEISLADDSVLERINSVLEPERTLLVAEKGDETPKLIVASPNFHFVGTMNPGGDYGKKELSPALRNRLTEIWSESSASNPDDLQAIIEHNLESPFKNHGIGKILTSFVHSWLHSNEALSSRFIVSIRDYLAWTNFINVSMRTFPELGLRDAVIHGASLVFLDGIGSGATSSDNISVSQNLRSSAMKYLETLTHSLMDTESRIFSEDFETQAAQIHLTPEHLQIGPFKIQRNGTNPSNPENLNTFTLDAPTTSQNSLRVLRALQLNKPILLEGSPGVGKTALVTALSQISNFSIVRINLSEQTDVSDLFGADLPVEGSSGQFAWRDGPLLQALKTNSWILLDELNLASQSVLEGLNACLDHRGEIYVPELNRTFKIGVSGPTRIFGCQNPVRQGGGRKGLPKSFLNRFTQVYMLPLSVQDLNWILHSAHPNIPGNYLEIMTHFADALSTAVSSLGLFGHKGSPWDFNLRDLLRWGNLITSQNSTTFARPELFLDFIYGRRLRTQQDYIKMVQLYCEISQKFGHPLNPGQIPRVGQSAPILKDDLIVCGLGKLLRKSKSKTFGHLQILHHQLPALEALAISVEMGWMPILVGASGSGKTSTVKLLAQLTGDPLRIMTVNSEMDTIELLGGFEQADIYRKIDEAHRLFSTIIENLAKSIVLNKGSKLSLMDSRLLELWSNLNSLDHLTPDGLVGNEEEIQRIDKRLLLLKSAYTECFGMISTHSFPPDLKTLILEDMSRFKIEMENIDQHLKAGIQNGAFQWIDSLLVKAIMHGDLLLIDGANRCSPAVLDRLNSLMEPSGVLTLSERGSIDGKIIEIKPHPNFRLILSMDPVYGEISRAMRNRGVEIFMPGPDEEIIVSSPNPNLMIPEENENSLYHSLSQNIPTIQAFANQINSIGKATLDLDALLRTEGLSNPVLRAKLIQFHQNLKESDLFSVELSTKLHSYQLVDFVRCIIMELEHNSPLPQALRNSAISTYCKGSLEKLSGGTRNQLETLLELLTTSSDNETCSLSLSLLRSQIPPTLPQFLNIQLYRLWRKKDQLQILLANNPPFQILGNVRDPNLYKEIIMLTTLERLEKTDIQPLILAWNNPNSDLGRFSKAIENVESSDSSPIYELKKSLLLYNALFLKIQASLNSWAPGTVGFICKNLRFSPNDPRIKNPEFLTAFSALLQNFDRLVHEALERFQNQEVSNYLTRALQSLFWKQRTAQLSHQPFEPTNEQLDSKLCLLVKWIQNHVVPLYNEVSASQGEELEHLVQTCLTHLDTDSAKLLDLSRAYRETINFRPFSFQNPETEDLGFVENVIKIYKSVWSLGALQNLLQFLVSEEGHKFVISFSEVLKSRNSEILEKLLEIVAKIETAECSPSETAVAGFLEYSSFYRNCAHHREASKNPLLSIHNLRSSEFQQFFIWEEEQRFCSSFFADSDSDSRGLLKNSCLLPYFIGNLILEKRIEIDEKPMIQNRLSKSDLRSITQRQSQLQTVKNILYENLSISPKPTDQLVQSELREKLFQNLSRNSILFRKSQVDEWISRIQFSNSNSAFEFEAQMCTLGSVMIESGSKLIEISSYLPLVDPAVEKETLANYLTQELSFFETWIESQISYQFVETGQNLLDSSISACSPYVSECARHIQILSQNIQEAQAFIAHRPFPPNYQKIRSEIRQFQCTYSSVQKMKSLADLAMKLITRGTKENLSEEKLNEFLVPARIWIDSHRNFVKNLAKDFWYWDLTAGFLVSSVQVSIGLSLISDSLFRLQFNSSAQNEEKHLLSSLLEFPIPFYNKNQDTRIPNLVDKLSPELSLSPEEHIRIKRSFLLSLITFLNETETESYLSSTCLRKFHQLCETYVHLWNFQEETKRRQKELQDALFLLKGKERVMELDEAEQEIRDISNNFPTYEDELIDLEIQNTLGDFGPVKKNTQGPETQPHDYLTNDDLNLWVKIHERIVRKVTNHWISPRSGDENVQISDFVTPLLYKFQEITYNLTKISMSIGKDIENLYIPLGTIGIHGLHSQYEPPRFFKSVQIHNFYHDPNVDEAKKMISIFNGLRVRVGELLNEWADHPSLLKILSILDRLESFDIQSPLMKFLTGLELLLGVSQEWEKCAHSGVSISIWLNEITDLIICWRKLEMSSWKNLLDITYQREQAECTKWWFYLYPVLMDYLQKQTPEPCSSVQSNLTRFMESSPIGQFSTRLNLILNFHFHLCTLKTKINAKTNLQTLLWNTYNFYNQFTPAVLEKLKSSRSPIEKKLKDSIKLSRWNDANFYSLKESISKNQRRLAKFVKDFKKIMSIPVSSILTADLTNPVVPISKKIKIPQNCSPDSYLILQDFQNYETDTKKTFQKAQNVLKPVLSGDSKFYIEEIENLAELTDTIITTVHELQNLEIPEAGAGGSEKRRKILHNVHSRRRTALADLFKVLTQELNLSYRRGLVQLTTNSDGANFLSLAEPMDPVAGWSNLNHSNCQDFSKPDQSLVSSWTGAETYFQKCFARSTALLQSFQNPSKELGPAIIERCKGFSWDLLGLVAGQKEFISEFTQALWNLRVLTQGNFWEGPEIVQYKKTHHGFCAFEFEAKQMEILVSEPLTPEFSASIQILLSKCHESKELLKPFVNLPTTIKVAQNNGIFEKCHDNLELIKQCLDPLKSKDSILGEIFSKLYEKLEQIEINPEISDSNSNPEPQFSRLTKKLVTKILLTFQKLSKLKDSEDLDLGFGPNLRKLSVVQISVFDLDSITRTIRTLFKISRNSKEPKVSNVLSSLIPLINQYSLVAQFYLTTFIQYHRSTCKLLSVISGIFATLGTKGFCLPADYEEDAVAEGPDMDASASGGMGLGDGETTPDAKDVSDRMESEDQLEDTLKAGETMESADKDLDDNEQGVEMSEDFDGKQQGKDKKESEDKDDDKNKDSDEEGSEEEEMDKEMGDVDEPDADKLDDQMWGGSSDEEDENLDEKPEETGKGSDSKIEQKELQAKDQNLEETSDPENEPQNPNEKDQEKKAKEINEQENDDEELNDNQGDPYHGEIQAEEPEPEPFDLPEDLNLDNGEAKDDENMEENPFDLDSKDKDTEAEPEPQILEDEAPKPEAEDISDDEDPDAQKSIDVEVENPENGKEPEPETEQMDTDEAAEVIEDLPKEEETEDSQLTPIESESKHPEPTPTPAENAEESKSNSDQTRTPNENAKGPKIPEEVDSSTAEAQKQQPNDETKSGATESSDGTGHEGKNMKENSTPKNQSQIPQQSKESLRKPGETNENRTLESNPENLQNLAKRLKTMEQEEQNSGADEIDQDENPSTQENSAELYKHIQNSDKSDPSAIDMATKEQAEKQKGSMTNPEEDQGDPNLEDENQEDEEIRAEPEEGSAMELESESKIPKKPKKSKDAVRHDTDESMNEEGPIEIEGEKSMTFAAQRPAESNIETRFDLLEEWSREKAQTDEILESSRIQVVRSFLTSEEEAASLAEWNELNGKTLHLSQQLCEQLRLVLEPTQAARLRGDYKTGKRLNMRKVIPYIASGFRKDKIWLRRTQPSKREYQILLALDDSASMADNQSKRMAFSSVAVVARALGLLEAGQLGIVSFGEETKLVHGFEEPFTELSGGRLVQQFTFNQRATRIAKLLEFTSLLFEQAKQNRNSSSASGPEFAQLLLIVSDGRGVSHEGSSTVKRAVRLAREKNIFIVFIIIDNPENKDSILDIRLPIFGSGPKGSVEIAKYMDHFPFPFYLILRDLSALPNIFADSLRQWFELVTSSER